MRSQRRNIYFSSVCSLLSLRSPIPLKYFSPFYFSWVGLGRRDVDIKCKVMWGSDLNLSRYLAITSENKWRWLSEVMPFYLDKDPRNCLWAKKRKWRDKRKDTGYFWKDRNIQKSETSPDDEAKVLAGREASYINRSHKGLPWWFSIDCISTLWGDFGKTSRTWGAPLESLI